MDQLNNKPTGYAHNDFRSMPWGAKALALINLILFGIAYLTITLIGILNIEKILVRVEEIARAQNIVTDIDPKSLQMLFSLQAMIAIFFIVTSVYLIKRREWARRGIVYFSFFNAALMLVMAIANPGAIIQAILNCIHPGLCIGVFTDKKVIAWFNGAVVPPQENACST